jgi:Tfp pilus assembly protein PilN
MRAVNLIPADHRSGGGNNIGRSGGAVYVVLGGLTVLVALMVLYALAATGMSDKQTQLSTLQTQIQQARASVTADVAPGQVRAERTQITSTVRQLAEQRMDWSTLLDNLGRTLPPNTTLNGLDASVDASSKGGGGATPAVPGAPGVAGPTVSLTGCSPSQEAVAELMPTLRGITGVDGVQLVSSSVKGPDAGAGGAVGTAAVCTGAQFEIVLQLEPLTPPAPVPGAAGTTPGATAATTTPGTTTPAPATSSSSAPPVTPAVDAPAAGAGG